MHAVARGDARGDACGCARVRDARGAQAPHTRRSEPHTSRSLALLPVRGLPEALGALSASRWLVTARGRRRWLAAAPGPHRGTGEGASVAGRPTAATQRLANRLPCARARAALRWAVLPPPHTTPHTPGARVCVLPLALRRAAPRRTHLAVAAAAPGLLCCGARRRHTPRDAAPRRAERCSSRRAASDIAGGGGVRGRAPRERSLSVSLEGAHTCLRVCNLAHLRLGASRPPRERRPRPLRAPAAPVRDAVASAQQSAPTSLCAPPFCAQSAQKGAVAPRLVRPCCGMWACMRACVE